MEKIYGTYPGAIVGGFAGKATKYGIEGAKSSQATRNAFNSSDVALANDLHLTPTGTLKQGTKVVDAETGKLKSKPVTIKKMKDPVAGKEVKPRTVLKNMQKNPQAYNDYFLQQQWQQGQGGRDWFANFGREQQGVPRIWEGTPIITEENAASITPERWTAAQDAAIESGRAAKTEIVPTWLSQEMIDRARSTTLENVLKNDEIISDYQFTQIFGVSKSEYMKQFENNANLLRKSGRSENEIKQWVKDVAEQRFKSDIEGQQKFRDDLSVLIKSEGEEPKDFILDSNNGILSNFRRGNIPIKDVRDVFRKMYKLLDSKEYKQRIINDGYSEEEATDMIKLFKGLMQNVKKAKYKDNLISQHGGAVRKTLNADGVYVHDADIVGIISKSTELSKAEKETLIHELFHSSDKAKPEAYMKRIKWMEPLDKSDKVWTEYMTTPTEQRVRALSALSDMKEMGLDLTDPASYEKYFNMPEHDHNYDSMINTFGKEQTHNFMRTIYGISIPLLLYGTTQK